MMKIVPSNENDAKINMLRNEKLLRYSYTVETITYHSQIKVLRNERLLRYSYTVETITYHSQINVLRNSKQLRNTYTSEIFSSAVLTVCSFVGLRFVFLFFQNRNICCRR